MIDVLNTMDDFKKIKNLLVNGQVKEAIKQVDINIAHRQKEVDEFELYYAPDIEKTVPSEKSVMPVGELANDPID